MSLRKQLGLAALSMALVLALAAGAQAQEAGARKPGQKAGAGQLVKEAELDRKIGAFEVRWQRLDLGANESHEIRLAAESHLSLEVFVLDANRKLLARVRGSPAATLRFKNEQAGRYFVVIRNRSKAEGLYGLEIL